MLGLTTGTLDALACPLSAGAVARLGFSIDIPDAASGLGELGIIVNATDQTGAGAFCLNLTVSL